MVCQWIEQDGASMIERGPRFAVIVCMPIRSLEYSPESPLRLRAQGAKLERSCAAHLPSIRVTTQIER